MNPRLLILSLALLLSLCAASAFNAASTSASQSAALVITHANVIDGVSNQPLRDATVIVRDGKIESVTTGAATIPANATVLDLKGKWLLPGFVDAHTHIADLNAARAALESGVTTARNMGISHFVDIGLRELNHKGVADLPEVLSAGYHIYPQPREGLYLDFPQLHDLMSGLKGVENVRRVVRLQIERGVNFIKVNATDRAGTVTTDPRKQLYSEEELTAIVSEARKSNIPVAAHAHGAAGGAAAVRAGAHSIEHGTYLTEDTLRMMKERGTFLVPTLATMAEMLESRNDVALQIRGKHMVPRLRETVTKAVKMGLKIVAGTDTDYSSTSNFRLPNEAMELVACGMSPMDAIKAATRYSAECLNVSQHTGAIIPGLEADLVAIERDPLADICHLQDVLLVINNGNIKVNRLAW